MAHVKQSVNITSISVSQSFWIFGRENTKQYISSSCLNQAAVIKRSISKCKQKCWPTTKCQGARSEFSIELNSINLIDFSL